MGTAWCMVHGAWCRCVVHGMGAWVQRGGTKAMKGHEARGEEGKKREGGGGGYFQC